MKKFMVFVWAILLFGLVTNAAIDLKKGGERYLLKGNAPVRVSNIISAISDDAYEDNDTLATAATLTPGVYSGLVLLDEDYFKVYVQAGKDLQVSLSGGLLAGGGGDMDIELYNASGDLLVASIGDSTNEMLCLSNVAAGWYFIRNAWWGDAHNYTLTIASGDLPLGEISGRVTDIRGSGIAHVWVTFYDLSGNWSLLRGHAPTDSNGDYHFAYTAGDHKVLFDATYPTNQIVGGYVNEWYNDVATLAEAQTLTTAAGSSLTGIDAVLGDAGMITGLVTGPEGQLLLYAYAQAYDSSGTWKASTYTLADGTYCLRGIAPAGNYIIRFRPPGGTGYAVQWYNNKSWSGAADAVPVVLRQETPNINAQLGYGGTISGQVTDAVSGLPIANVTVRAVDEGNITISSVVTNATGQYTIYWVPACNVKLYFNAGTTGYVSEWYNNSASFATADVVPVVAGQNVTGINAQLGIASPTITVTSPNGGESWQAGTTHDITWNSSGPISAVKIEVSFNGGDLWSTIITSTPNDGSYSWDIVKVPSLNCFMRISDVLGTSSDTSDAPFVLQSPPSLTNNYFILPVKWTDTPFGSGGWYVGDYDGDGRSDLLRYLLDGTRNEVLLSTGSAFAAGTNWLTADHGADGWHVGDYNGDGRSDLMRYVPGVSGAQVFLSNGSNFIYSGSWTGVGNGADGWYVGDYNGDGRDDIMRYVPGVSGADVFLSDGTKFNYSGNWSGAGNGADGWYIGDFNGDGRSDLMRYYPGVSGGEVFLSDGTKFTYSGSWTGAGNGDNGWYLGKFSGTARTDIMRYVLLLSGADVFLNGDGVYHYDGSWTPAGRGDNDWHVGDFNGDGRDDLMRSIVGVTGADVLLSTKISGSSSSATPMAIQANRGTARWMNDVPASKPLSAEELTLLEGIKARMAAGEEITIYQVQREYEMLTGKLLTRAGIMKLLKRQQWDSLYKLKAEDLLQ